MLKNQEVIKLLKKGKTIIYPTDTAYALGGDLLNSKTRRAVFKLKKREVLKQLPAIANSLAMVKKYCYINAVEEKLAKKYWPGPLSLVLQVKPLYQKILGKDLAVRVPDNEIARYLSCSLGKPLISTSANISGQVTGYDIKQILKQFKKTDVFPDIIIDNGELPKRLVSTIIKVENKKINILRRGAIKLKNYG